MNQQRKAKLKKRAEREQRSEQRKLEFAEGALRHAGLYEAFRRMPAHLQRWSLNLVHPAAEILLDPSAEDCEFARGMQRGFLGFQRRPFKLPDRLVTPLEMLSFLEPLSVVIAQAVESVRAANPSERNTGLLDFVAQLRAFVQQHLASIHSDFVGSVWTLLLWNSRFDQRMLWSTYARVVEKGRSVVQVRVHRKTPERRKIIVNGQPRPAFRCCLPQGANGLQEVAWRAGDIGFPDDAREYPVFMQSHALEQVEKRVPCSHPIYPIVCSLMTPKFVPLGEDRFLFEYHYLNHKLGYFVGVKLEDCVLLKTFLFLTMQGTPESDLLYRKLRLTRSDIEYLQLDELAAFRDPEVRNDPALVELLDDCGCGHLLTFSAADLSQELATGYAGTLRRYLGTIDAI